MTNANTIDSSERKPTAIERLNASGHTIAELEATIRSVIFDGIISASRYSPDGKELDDPTGCESQFIECVKQTFNYGNTREECRLEQYTYTILLAAKEDNPANPGTKMIKFLTDDWILREIIEHVGDADGKKRDILRRLHMNARVAIGIIVDQITELAKVKRAAGEVVPTIFDDSDDDIDAAISATNMEHLQL